MADGIEVARAYVTIIPSLEGSQKTITKELTGATEEAGEAAGKKSGDKFSGSFGSTIKSGAKLIGGAIAGATAAAAGAAKGLWDAASATAQYGDNIDKLSQKIGLSSTAYQEWEFIAQHSGTSMESLKTAMVKLSTAAEKGSDAFEALGISQEEAQSMSREELWNATILALTGVEDETERARIAQDLFGKGATEMGALLNTSAEDIEAMRQQVHDLGGVMSEDAVKASAAFQDSLQNLQTSITGMKNNLTAELLPGITGIMDGLTQVFTGDSEGGLVKIKEGIASISETIKETLPGLIETGSEILTTLISAVSEALPELVPLAVTIITQLGAAIIENLPTLLTAGADILAQLVSSIIKNAPSIVTAALEAITQFVGGITKNLPTVLAKGGEILQSLIDGIFGTGEGGEGGLLAQGTKVITDIVSGIGGALPDILKAGGEIVSNLLSGIGDENSGLPCVMRTVGQFITDLVSTLGSEEVSNGISKIIESFGSLLGPISTAITDIIAAIAPFIPDITSMVETCVTEIPKIVDSFSSLLEKIGPIIDSISGVIDTIGTAIVNIVDSVGTNLTTIIDAFTNLNASLKDPIEAIGTAISGIITSISDGVVKINDSVANILEKLSGVFDSIGEAATKAGDGFATVADAAIRLANQTNVFDLVATLVGIAKGIKDINKEAGWMADHDIANKLEKIGAPLKTITDNASGLGTTNNSVSGLATAIKSLNNETKNADKIVSNIGKIKDSVLDLGTQIGTLGTDLTAVADTAIADVDRMNTGVTTTLSALETTFSGKNYNLKYYMTDAFDTINGLSLQTLSDSVDAAMTGMDTSTQTATGSIASSFSTMESDITGSLSTMDTSAKDATDNIASYFRGLPGIVSEAITSVGRELASATWNPPHISTPHFYWTGVWDTDGSDGRMSAPSLNVSWYDKGGVFTQPTVIGIAERRPEFVGALDDLRDIVREEAGPHDVTINVYGAEGQDVRALADIVMDRIQHSIDRREAAYA